MSSEHAALVRVYVRSDPMGEEARTLVASIRDMSIGSLETYVAGPAAIDEDMNEQVFHRFLWVFLLMMVITYLSLFWLLKSVLLPLKAIILNLASVAATYGILIFVFQQGHFGGVLNFTSDGTINLQVLIIVFCIVFGISMDYEVFLLSRIKEEWEKTKDNTASVALGLAQTGRVITSSSLVMVATFGTFAISELVLLKMVGLGLAIAILLDATIIRIMITEAVKRGSVRTLPRIRPACVRDTADASSMSFVWAKARATAEPAHPVAPATNADCHGSSFSIVSGGQETTVNCPPS